MQHHVGILLLLIGLTVAHVEQVPVQDSAQEDGEKTSTADSLLSEKMLEDVGDYLRAFCVWDGRSSDPALIDQVALQSAIENSSGWIKAVLRPEYVPEDIEKRIQGVVDDVMGWDATRVRFDAGRFEFLVTQTASHINVVVSPGDEALPACCGSPPGPKACLRATIENVFGHGRAILHMSSLIDEVSSGIRMRVRRPPSGIEDPRAFAEQEQILHDELRKLDAGLPDHLRAGPFFHWWGTVYTMSDGCAVVVHARKCTGGGVMADLVKGWFRKEKLPGPYTGRFSPRPPEDIPGRCP